MQHSGHLYENKVSVQGPAMPKWEPVINTMSLVATLITTVTFAAAFTMPGGFDASPADLGVAVLVKKAALQTFILSDTIAMCCSITVVFLLLWALILGNNAVWTLATISMTLLSTALSATLVAFMSGIFAVIARKTLWVAILVCIFCSMAPFALGVTEFLNTCTILAVIPSGVLVRDMIKSMERAMKKLREQDINVPPHIQGRSPDTSHSMINTNAEV
ncbi:hypothetical protein Vadar_003661 [Vaccinium darrowii]|uniref:Uncharacterized protein n=1 Tax=Vaccinium darrowii TaxID=229202 RepID=A0ACB7XMW4_9ERIC|nr:hypothetical protein Vadar_003661 [Vaccinium darrowii]